MEILILLFVLWMFLVGPVFSLLFVFLQYVDYPTRWNMKKFYFLQTIIWPPYFLIHMAALGILKGFTKFDKWMKK